MRIEEEELEQCLSWVWSDAIGSYAPDVIAGGQGFPESQHAWVSQPGILVVKAWDSDRHGLREAEHLQQLLHHLHQPTSVMQALTSWQYLNRC